MRARFADGRATVIVDGYRDRERWIVVEVTRPAGVRRWGPSAVRQRLDGRHCIVPAEADRWWEPIGPNSYWRAGLTEDREWNIAAADGDFSPPFMTVNELGTVSERRRRGLASSLLDLLKNLTGLQPIPEIVRQDEDEGLAIPFWRSYLPAAVVALIEKESRGKWGRIEDLLRQCQARDELPREAIYSG